MPVRMPTSRASRSTRSVPYSTGSSVRPRSSSSSTIPTASTCSGRASRNASASASLPYFLELASPTISKGTGLAFVAGQLGFAAEHTVAFGDGENDLELLEWAGFAVAVENAHNGLKARADWICPGAADEGVAQVLEAILDSRP